MQDTEKTEAQLISELKEMRQINCSLQKELKEIKQKHDQSESFFRNIINSFDEPVFVKDSQHRWVFFNDSAYKHLGLSKEDIIGESDYDIFPKEQADIYWERDNIVLKSGKTDLNEEPLTIHGKQRIISTKKSLYMDTDSGEKYIVGTIQDITEKKRTERALIDSEQFLRQIIDTTPAHIFVKNSEGKFLLVNKMVAESHGTKPEEMVGKSEIEFTDYSKEKIKEINKFT